MSATFTTLSAAAAAMVALYLWRIPGVARNGFWVDKFRTTSGENPVDQVRGHRWSSYRNVAQTMSSPGMTRPIHLDNFCFFPSSRPRNGTDALFRNMPRRHRHRVEKKIKANLDALTTAQGLVFLGQMGSGKTVTYTYLLAQHFYNRAIIHDAKLDYISQFYRPGIDLLLNPYDDRNTAWDVLGESPATIETFFANLMSAVVGGKQDYFSAAAQKKFRQIAMKTTLIEGPPVQKWAHFINDVETLFAEVKQGDQRSEKDVISTMDQVLDTFKLIAFQVAEGRPTFTIKSFFEKHNQNKIFLANNAQFEKVLNPYFGAFLACFSQIHMSLEDTKTDFTLYLLDEYLSFASIIDETSRRRLHTQVRSKGGLLYVGLQMIPSSDKRLEEDLSSSAYGYIIFSVMEKNTKAFVQSLIAKWKYRRVNLSRSNRQTTVSESEVEENIIDQSDIDQLAKDYAHITFIPSEGILYRGRSPYIELPKRCESFIPYDTNAFYRHMVDRPDGGAAQRAAADAAKDILSAMED